MSKAPHSFAYQSMGTSWEISIWDDIDPTVLGSLKQTIIARSEEFDRTYSRFKKTSLIWKLADACGIHEVPAELTEMLKIYARLHDLSGGAMNPLIGHTLSDMGYDADYSLKPAQTIRPVPDFPTSLRIIDETHIELMQPALIDLGAIGKGFFVDKLWSYLRSQGVRRFLVNGSGDIRYSGDGMPIRAGLEHPGDPTKVIGVLDMYEGALCASASNRRAWDKYHHTISPHTLASPKDIIATWVLTDSAALADGLCTCLFLTEPQRYTELKFEYCLLTPDYTAKRSAGFRAELF